MARVSGNSRSSDWLLRTKEAENGGASVVGDQFVGASELHNLRCSKS